MARVGLEFELDRLHVFHPLCAAEFVRENAHRPSDADRIADVVCRLIVHAISIGGAPDILSGGRSVKIKYLYVALFLVCIGPAIGWCVEPRTEHTFQLEADDQRPSATLEDAGWLVGSWVGTAFGQRFEEVWNPPSAGSMLGLFKLYGDDGIAFYELLLMTVDDGTLSLKVKHFNADFTAWEEKGDFVNFRLVKKEKDALHFGGISFYRRGDDSLDGYIVMRNGDEVTEHHLKYERRR